jgi:hypothetical protein
MYEICTHGHLVGPGMPGALLLISGTPVYGSWASTSGRMHMNLHVCEMGLHTQKPGVSVTLVSITGREVQAIWWQLDLSLMMQVYAV